MCGGSQRYIRRARPKPTLMIHAGILALIDRLQQPGDGLCHGDIHPENVIMTADDPRLIDWTFSIRAPAALDHRFTHISLTEFALDVTARRTESFIVRAWPSSGCSMSASGYVHASPLPRKQGISNSITRRNRCTAVKGRSAFSGHSAEMAAVV